MTSTVWTLSLAVLLSSIDFSHSCSCMPAHPQDHYCSSDFVILARVKKDQIIETPNQGPTKIYKVRIRKQFRITEKGLVALKSGKIHTPMHSAMCGVNLQIGKLYVLSGNIYSLRANVLLCNMVAEWNSLSRRQRKGLRMTYKRGCGCKIKNCMFARCRANYWQKDTCLWKDKCEVQEGICLRQKNGSCMWNKNKMLTACRAGFEAPRAINTTTVERRTDTRRLVGYPRGIYV